MREGSYKQDRGDGRQPQEPRDQAVEKGRYSARDGIEEPLEICREKIEELLPPLSDGDFEFGHEGG